MEDKIEKKRLAILRCLAQASGPLSSEKLTVMLRDCGIDVPERTIRFHLTALDQTGLTEYIGKHGRVITARGRDELANARVFERVGFMSARIDQLTYEMSFNPDTRAGTLIVNVSLVEKEYMRQAWELMRRVFTADYSMGKLVCLFEPGEMIGDMFVPNGYYGVGTVCSITLNGILLHYGIPVASRFGGLLEVREHRPYRFVAVINYDGTSLDPLEIFIKSSLTDYRGATANGSGRIGASFREVPAASRARILEIIPYLEELGLGCILELGLPGQPLREIPVNQGNIGLIVRGGLNPIAMLEESGVHIVSKAMSGFVDYKRLFRYDEMEVRLG